MANYLALLIAIPLLGAATQIIFPKSSLNKFLLVSIPAFTLGLSALLLLETKDVPITVAQIGGWPAGISIPLVSDTLSSLMLVTTSLLILVCNIFAISTKDAEERYFTPLVLVLTAGINGALLTADVFNLFVFIELIFLPSCGLIILRKGIKNLAAPRLYVTVNLLTSGILLTGVAMVYATQGTVNLGLLANSAQESDMARIAIGIVLIALGIKAALVPAHGWLARTYPATSPVVSALFSGLHTKIAIYAFFRIYSVTFGSQQQYIWFFTIFFIASMVIGGLGALGESNTRSILTFHMISQIGYVMLGLAFFGPLGLSAAIFYLIHNMVVKVSLFLSLSSVEETYGTSSIKKLSGLAKKEPVVATTFFLGAISLAGLPPFSGFIAKLYLASAALDARNYVATAAIAGVSIITLMSMLKIWSSIFWDDKETTTKSKPKVPYHMVAPAIFLVVLSLAMGLNADFFLEITDRAAQDLVNIERYSEAVLSK